MFRTVCKSKIHGATVTEANLQYTGSLTLDPHLMQAADLVPYEQVQVVNLNNGERFETYCIEGAPGSGTVCLNGAAARLALVGDKIIIISYAQAADEELREHVPKLVFLDEQNRIRQVVTEDVRLTPPVKPRPWPGELEGGMSPRPSAVASGSLAEESRARARERGERVVPRACPGGSTG